jgi:protein O-GlcNAc transferase
MSAPGRNDPCLCGSGKKYKQCCLGRTAVSASAPPRSSGSDELIRRGLEHLSNNRLDEAEDVFRRASVYEPSSAEIQYHLGYALSLKGDFDQALVSYRRAIALDPRFAEAFINLGSLLGRQGRLDEAVTCYKKGLALKPDIAEAQLYLGHALSGLGRLADAVIHYQKVVEMRPDFIEAYGHLIGTLIRLGRMEAAIECASQAVGHHRGCAELHYQLARALKQGNRLDEAVIACERALALDPAHDEAACYLGHLRLNQGYHEQASAICRGVLARRPDLAAAYETSLFGLLYGGASAPEEVHAAHVRYGERFESPLKRFWRPHTNVRDPDRRLKVGYVSADFRYHSVAFFIEPLLARHDRDAVEVYCYHSHSVHDAITDRFARIADHWVPSGGLSDERLAERIRGEGIDILVDLAGHTGDNRLLVFARKPAPVQVTYLGYPTTTGLSAMDWRLTTWEVDPEGSERWYTERLYRLPRTLWCYRSPQEGECGEMAPTPALSKGHVTFGSMNHLAKISQETVEVWGAILRELPDARLVMTSIPEGMAQERLKERFAAQGIPPERLRLHGRLPAERFRALSRGIDIVLDPFPYNGTTTTCEALWMGLPVITLIGKTSVARSGYALLKTVGLEGLCAKDGAEYVRIAAGLARNPSRLDALRQGMRSRLEASPLRDEEGFARDIEEAYREMWREWCHADP